jgi:integrase
MALRKANGKWHYRFQVDGLKVAETTGLADTRRNEPRARMMESQHRQAVSEGKWGLRRLEQITFSDASELFLAQIKLDHAAKPGTWKRVETSMSSLTAHFGKMLVSSVRLKDVEAYKSWRLTDHKVKEITCRHDLHALSKFFQWARKMGYCRENITEDVSIPSDADAIRMHVLSSEEEKLYFAHATGDLHDSGRLLILQGTRPQELHSLEQADVDLARGVMHIQRGKTKAARRTLTLTSESKTILGRRLDGKSRWVFPSPRKPGAHVGSLDGSHNRVLKKTGLAFVQYDLRHSFATRLAESGVDLPTLASILGHSSIRCVMRYVHPTEAHQREAMVKYDGALQAAQQTTIH